MQLFEALIPLRQQLLTWRQAGERIAFVPTMGNLHAGHMSLIQQAQKHADRVVVSIFVNPLQFDQADDLARYPRTLQGDQQLLQAAAVDVLYLPDAAQLYPHGINDSVRVHVPGLSDILEGAARPGHFSGVTTVVAKLFNMVQPDIALFGEKDWQQLVLIRRMVKDLLIPLQVVGVATVREADGLAMSSRNSRLSVQERQQAAELYQVLSAVRDHWRQKGTINAGDWQQQEQLARAELEKRGLRADYVCIRNGVDLSEPLPGTLLDGQSLVLLAAVWLGKTRLIDHLSLEML